MKLDISREKALKILYDIIENKGYSNIKLEESLNDGELRDIDRAFISEMIYGTLRYLLTIDAIIEKFSKVKIKKISPWIMNILRLGVYQMVYMRVPDSAACNESVKLAKKYGHIATVGFVNGILRSVSKNIGELQFDMLEEKYSFPKWIVDRWIKAFGESFAVEIMKSLNERPKTCIRMNTLKTDVVTFEKTLTEEGVAFEKGKHLPDAYYISTAGIDRLKSFKKGYFYVQDESTMLAVRVLAPECGEKILDVCAAPGGKSAYVSSLMKNSGSLVSADIHIHRIGLLKQNFERLGVTNADAIVFDALEFKEEFEGKFDRVIVDVPCSGLGIIRKKPEIKWTRKNEDIEELAQMQKNILQNASRYVKDGGVLVYSTCTIEHEENQDVVSTFLENNGELFVNDPIGEYLPQTILSMDKSSNFITLYPHLHGTDGFFIARLRKK